MTFIQYEQFNFRDKTLALIDQANLIIDAHAEEGYTLTLRQLYYQFVQMNWLENNERNYKNLGNIINDARMAGLISWDAIEDRVRAVEPWLIEETQVNALWEVEMRYARDLWTPQKAYVEVWPEKDAVSGIVLRPCQRYRVPMLACRGYLSASEAWRAGQRFEAALDEGKHCVVIHIGDWDPSGRDMTRDNDERLGIFAGSGVHVRRIALNWDQVQQYNPPPNPLKVKADGTHSDTRAKDYIAHMKAIGAPDPFKSWELDALKPNVIDKLVSDAIEDYITDKTVWEQVLAEEEAERVPLRALYPNWERIKNYMANVGMIGQG